MNVEKSSARSIDIHIIPVTDKTTTATTTTTTMNVTSKSVKTDSSFSLFRENWTQNVWNFYVEDINRVIFPLKVGLAVLLVSLLILIRAPYEVFGTNIIWAIITTAIMFEYTVGMTLNRGFNRAVGSSIAGILAIAIAQTALCTGSIAEPIIIGAGIFFIGAITSFMKLWPSLVPYEYAFRVTLFTFCMIIVSGYRMGNPIRVSMDRLYSVALGGIIAVMVNVLVFPIWAGEQLHQELSNSFTVVADALEECVNKYLESDGSGSMDFPGTVLDEYLDEPAYKKCRNIFSSTAKLETLANYAKWEPPHGRFRRFLYPWSEYVKVGHVLRRRAYQVMALHGVLHSEIQAPHNLRMTFKQEILDSTNQAAELLRSLGKDINNMKQSVQASTTLLERVHSSAAQLQWSINTHSYLFIPSVISHDKPNPDTAQSKPIEVISYHEMMMRKHVWKLHSCPSIKVDHLDHDALEDQTVAGDRDCVDLKMMIPRMKAFESTSVLSLVTFASLLIEFSVRLDHLVEAVDELSKLAKFNQYAINPI